MVRQILFLVFISISLFSCVEKREKYYPSGAIHWIEYGAKDNIDSIILYHENGYLNSKLYYSGVHNFREIKYHQEGYVRLVRNFTDGKLNGRLFSLSKKGDTIIKEYFDMGNLVYLKYFYCQDSIRNMDLCTPQDTTILNKNQKTTIFMACFSPSGIEKRLYLSEYRNNVNSTSDEENWVNTRTLHLTDGYLSKFDTSFSNEGMHSLVYSLEGFDMYGELKGLKAKQVVFIVK